MVRHLGENLSAYLANELTPAERLEAEQHLSECEECRNTLAKLQRVNEALSKQQPIEPPADFLDRVQNKIDRDNKVIAFRSRKTIAWIAIAAAIVFIVFLLKLLNPVPPATPVVSHRPKPPVAPVVKPQTNMAQQNVPVVSEHPTTPQHPVVAAVISPEDEQVIANLDALQNMELLENYDNIENLDLAVLGAAQGKE